jgi:hypothetical protein
MIGCIDQRGARQELTFKTLSCNLGSKTYIIGGSLDSTLPNSRIKAGSKTARSDIVESMVGDVAHSFNNLLSIVSGHAATLPYFKNQLTSKIMSLSRVSTSQ